MEKQERRVLELDQYEHGVVINALNEMRNDLIEEERPTDIVDEVLLKTIDAPSSSQIPYRLFPRKREKHAHSIAPPLPTESTDSAGAPDSKRRCRDEER